MILWVALGLLAHNLHAGGGHGVAAAAIPAGARGQEEMEGGGLFAKSKHTIVMNPFVTQEKRPHEKVRRPRASARAPPSDFAAAYSATVSKKKEKQVENLLIQRALRAEVQRYSKPLAMRSRGARKIRIRIRQTALQLTDHEERSLTKTHDFMRQVDEVGHTSGLRGMLHIEKMNVDQMKEIAAQQNRLQGLEMRESATLLKEAKDLHNPKLQAAARERFRTHSFDHEATSNLVALTSAEANIVHNWERVSVSAKARLHSGGAVVQQLAPNDSEPSELRTEAKMQSRVKVLQTMDDHTAGQLVAKKQVVAHGAPKGVGKKPTNKLLEALDLSVKRQTAHTLAEMRRTSSELATDESHEVQSLLPV